MRCPICNRVLVKVQELYRCLEHSLFYDSRRGIYDDSYLLLHELRMRSKLAERIYMARWEFVREHVSEISSKVLLDFGCGSGGFGNAANGCKHVYSYDPIYCQKHDFLSCEAIDILTLWDSIEHMSSLEAISLIDAEHVFVTAPIIDRVFDIFSWKHYKPHEHIWYFSADALIDLFDRWSYHLVKRCDIEAKLRSKDIASFYFAKSER